MKSKMEGKSVQTFVAHSMVCRENIGCAIVLIKTFNKIVYAFGNLINNLNIVEVDG